MGSLGSRSEARGEQVRGWRLGGPWVAGQKAQAGEWVEVALVVMVALVVVVSSSPTVRGERREDKGQQHSVTALNRAK